jgi:hypothetical protein
LFLPIKNNTGKKSFTKLFYKIENFEYLFLMVKGSGEFFTIWKLDQSYKFVRFFLMVVNLTKVQLEVCPLMYPTVRSSNLSDYLLDLLIWNVSTRVNVKMLLDISIDNKK